MKCVMQTLITKYVFVWIWIIHLPAYSCAEDQSNYWENDQDTGLRCDTVKSDVSVGRPDEYCNYNIALKCTVVYSLFSYLIRKRL